MSKKQLKKVIKALRKELENEAMAFDNAFRDIEKKHEEIKRLDNQVNSLDYENKELKSVIYGMNTDRSNDHLREENDTLRKQVDAFQRLIEDNVVATHNIIAPF